MTVLVDGTAAGGRLLNGADPLVRKEFPFGGTCNDVESPGKGGDAAR